MTYAFPAWESVADSYLLKLQSLKSYVLGTTGNLSRRTPTRDLHMAFKIPYLYDFVTKLCRQRATVMLNHENVSIRNIGQSEAQRRKWQSGIGAISCLECGYILGQYMNSKQNLCCRPKMRRKRKKKNGEKERRRKI
jgi:hypothetical protein